VKDHSEFKVSSLNFYLAILINYGVKDGSRGDDIKLKLDSE